MSATVRERIAEIQKALRDDDIPPSRAREYAIELAGLHGNIHREVLDAELAYNAVLSEAFATEQKANRATLKANTTPEYRRYLEAKLLLKLASMMRSTLNTVLRSLEIESRL